MESSKIHIAAKTAAMAGDTAKFIDNGSCQLPRWREGQPWDRGSMHKTVKAGHTEDAGARMSCTSRVQRSIDDYMAVRC